MTNSVVTTSPFGTNLSLRGGAAAMAAKLAGSAAAGAIGTAPDGSDYMNFSGKRGVYEFGKDKTDVGEDELWLVNVENFEDGWVCWKGGRPIATRLASVYGQPAPEPDMNEHGPFNQKNGEGWFNAKSLVCRSIDEGRQGYFKINSKSGVAVFAALQEQVAHRLADGRPCWPLIQWGKEKFQAQGNWNFKPTIKVYGWLDTEAVVALGGNPDLDIDDLMEASEKGTVSTLVGGTPGVQQAAAVEPEPEPEPEPEEVNEPVPAAVASTRRARRGL